MRKPSQQKFWDRPVLRGRLVRARGFVLVLLALAYPVVSYKANVAGRPGVAGILFAFLPALALLVGLAWSARPRVLWLGLVAVATGILWRYWHVFRAHYSWVFLAEDVATLSLLSVLFAKTLKAGSVPLITRLSTLVHGSLSPLLARYTRRVTTLWAALFAVLAATSVLLFLWAPRPLWALYANVLTWPIMVAVFVGEYFVRRRVIPPEQCAGFIEVMRAGRKHWRTIAAADNSAQSPCSKAPL